MNLIKRTSRCQVHTTTFIFFILAIFIPFSSRAGFSWQANPDAGFGFYLPDGWTASHEGRSSRLTGPSLDTEASSIFIASDWSSKVRSLAALGQFLTEEAGVTGPIRMIHQSGLDGWAVGDQRAGTEMIFREKNNFIVIRYELRGSGDQIEEGIKALERIEIRSGGLDN